MKFKLIGEGEISRIHDRQSYYYRLPNIDSSSMVPLYTAITGSNKLECSRSSSRGGYGVQVHSHDDANYSSIYEVTEVTFVMVFIDKLDYYKELHAELVETRRDYQMEVDRKDIRRIRYKLKQPKLGFPEQKYLQSVMPTIAGDLITLQLESETQLKMANLILV